jgi:hypothetical protein
MKGFCIIISRTGTNRPDTGQGDENDEISPQTD